MIIRFKKHMIQFTTETNEEKNDLVTMGWELVGEDTPTKVFKPLWGNPLQDKIAYLYRHPGSATVLNCYLKDQ